MTWCVRVAWVGGALLLTACGAHRPARSVPEQAAVAPDSLEVAIGKIRRLSVAAVPKRNAVATVETQNAEVRTALEALQRGATPERHRRVADAYRSVGILDLAYDHFVAARDLDSRDAAAYDGLARIWRDWGLPHLGLADARRALYYAPQSAAAHNTFGTLLQALGQRTEARRAFERALALDPGAAYAWTNLCYQSFQAGDFVGAAASCRRALTVDPGLAAAHNNLGLVYAAAGQAKLAEAEFAAVGDAAARQYNVGIVFAASRKYADAADAFEAAGRLRPGWTMAAERARQARRLAQ
jgi:tetratricopeptide (TPR) repeat protein